MGGITSSYYSGGHGYYNHGADYLIGSVVRIHGKPYKFLRRLGAGGFGTVYAARGPHHDEVAIKAIDLSQVPEYADTLVNSYLTEVKHLARLRQESHHVVHIYDFDFDSRSGQAYMVMELGGQSLSKFIEDLSLSKGKSKEPGTFISSLARQYIWRQLVSIVKVLTKNNIVHMDLKPENLILFGHTLKIIDLGIAKKSNVLGFAGVGTPQFSAPEIMQATPGYGSYYGPKADIWSLGAILYYMTYGDAPEYVRGAADPPPRKPPSRDRDLVDILRRTLVLDPHARADIYTLMRHPFTNRRV